MVQRRGLMVQRNSSVPGWAGPPAFVILFRTDERDGPGRDREIFVATYM